LRSLSKHINQKFKKAVGGDGKAALYFLIAMAASGAAPGPKFVYDHE
jgi:hypothetical protein